MARTFELRGFVGEDFAGRAVLPGNFESIGVLQPGRMKRQGNHGLTVECWFACQRKKGYFVNTGEGIGSGEENGHIVFWVRGDDGRLNELRRAVGAADENVGLAAVAKSLQDVRDREEVALIVNEEAVAKEAVVVPARGWRSIQLINHGTDGGGESRVVGRVLGNRADRQAAEETDKQGYQP